MQDPTGFDPAVFCLLCKAPRSFQLGLTMQPHLWKQMLYAMEVVGKLVFPNGEVPGAEWKVREAELSVLQRESLGGLEAGMRDGGKGCVMKSSG